MTDAPHLEPAPDWSAGSIADVLPAVARSLGVQLSGAAGSAASAPLAFPSAQRAVVVLVDGMGERLLHRYRGHAPFLRSLLATGATVPAGFPTTTATSMGSFGTGLLPGAHGLASFTVLDPQTDRIFNELSWEDGPDPMRWQPFQTVFQRCENDGVQVVRVGPGYFDGSGLTTAALRGGRFVAAKALEERVEATLAALWAAPRSLVYLYWGDLDRKGHEFGCRSWEWLAELEAVDAALGDLSRRVPPGTLLVITADHGMVDVPLEQRLDLAARPDLAADVRHVGGEPRNTWLYCEAGRAEAVRDRWVAEVGTRADVLLREEVMAAGWWVDVRPEVLDRLGDVIVLCRGEFAVVDTVTMRPEVLRLVGVHGSTSEDELAIPILHVPPR